MNSEILIFSGAGLTMILCCCVICCLAFAYWYTLPSTQTPTNGSGKVSSTNSNNNTPLGNNITLSGSHITPPSSTNTQTDTSNITLSGSPIQTSLSPGTSPPQVQVVSKLNEAARSVLPLFSWQGNGPDQGGLVWNGVSDKPWNATYKFKCCKDSTCSDLTSATPKVSNNAYKCPMLRLSKGYDPNPCAVAGGMLKVFRERGDGNYAEAHGKNYYSDQTYDGKSAVFMDGDCDYNPLTRAANAVLPWFTSQGTGPESNRGGLVWQSAETSWNATYKFQCCKDGQCGKQSEASEKITNNTYNCPKLRVSKDWEPNPCAAIGGTLKVFRERGDSNYAEVTGSNWGGEPYDGKSAVFIDDAECKAVSSLTDAANAILPFFTTQYTGPADNRGGLVWVPGETGWNATYKFRCVKGSTSGGLSAATERVTNHSYKQPSMRIARGWEQNACEKAGGTVRIYRERGDGNYREISGTDFGGAPFVGKGSFFNDRS